MTLFNYSPNNIPSRYWVFIQITVTNRIPLQLLVFNFWTWCAILLSHVQTGLYGAV